MLGELLDNPDFRGKFETPQRQADAEGVALADALRRSWEEPIDFPPLHQAVYPGDQVVLVLQHQLPQPRAVIEVVVDQLLQWGLELEDLSVVVSPATARSLGIQLREPAGAAESTANQIETLTTARGELELEVHNAFNSHGLSYVAANEGGLPVYLNRRLVDADLVLPISAPQPGQQADCLYPEFADDAGRLRLADAETDPRAAQEEVLLANDMLGAFFTVQLVYGPGQRLQDVISGARQEAGAQAQQEVTPLWRVEYHGEAGVALASIESEPGEQSWSDVADAVGLADVLVPGEGPLVIWSQLEQEPGAGVRRACQAPFESVIELDDLPERLQLLADVLGRRPVYLHSRLDANLVEELGLGYIDTAEEVLRVARPFEQGLLIRDAHRCRPPSSRENSRSQ